MKTKQLLCTFSTNLSYTNDIKKISDLYQTSRIKYFVFENHKFKNEVYITYNIDFDTTFIKYPSTISIHRKKETNTLYTLNSLNVLIKEENGKLDKNFIIDWKLYRNCFILTGDISVRIIDLDLLKVF